MGTNKYVCTLLSVSRFKNRSRELGKVRGVSMMLGSWELGGINRAAAGRQAGGVSESPAGQCQWCVLLLMIRIKMIDITRLLCLSFPSDRYRNDRIMVVAGCMEFVRGTTQMYMNAFPAAAEQWENCLAAPVVLRLAIWSIRMYIPASQTERDVSPGVPFCVDSSHGVCAL